MDAEELAAALSAKQTILQILKRTLHDLQVKEAQYGIDVPTAVRNEIHLTKERIIECENEIVKLKAEMSIEEQINSDNENKDSPDSFLLFWVTMAENHGMETTIILSMNGMLISGVVVSFKRYMQVLLELFEEKLTFTGSDNPDESKQAMIRGFRSALLPEDEQTADNKEEETTYTIIHLIKARIWQPSTGGLITEGGPWRIKLSAVNGFTMGMLT